MQYRFQPVRANRCEVEHLIVVDQLLGMMDELCLSLKSSNCAAAGDRLTEMNVYWRSRCRFDAFKLPRRWNVEPLKR
jgi:hypothetical protein